jgi:hypothetical protein
LSPLKSSQKRPPKVEEETNEEARLEVRVELEPQDNTQPIWKNIKREKMKD